MSTNNKLDLTHYKDEGLSEMIRNVLSLKKAARQPDKLLASCFTLNLPNSLTSSPNPLLFSVLKYGDY